MDPKTFIFIYISARRADGLMDPYFVSLDFLVNYCDVVVYENENIGGRRLH